MQGCRRGRRRCRGAGGAGEYACVQVGHDELQESRMGMLRCSPAYLGIPDMSVSLTLEETAGYTGHT